MKSTIKQTYKSSRSVNKPLHAFIAKRIKYYELGVFDAQSYWLETYRAESKEELVSYCKENQVEYIS